MTATLTTRNATAQDLVRILNEQKAHKLDVVVPSTHMKSANGLIIVKDSEAHLGEDGVTTVNGTYRPTEVFNENIAERLKVPGTFLKRLFDERVDLYDKLVNGLLHGAKRPDGEVVYPADERAFLLRLFRGDDGGEGVARSFLSNSYGLSMDNLDMLIAVQKGITDAGVNVITRVSDLSERGMRIRFEAPDIHVDAPRLLENYRDPFSGNGRARRAGSFDELRQQYGAHHIFSEKDAPIAFIGFDFGNSETGEGAYYLTPVLEYVRCTNGWVYRKEGIRKRHIGSRMETGIVQPSADTLRKAGALVAAETRDAVAKWLTPAYLQSMVDGFEDKAVKPVASPSTTVPAICAGLGFTDDEAKGVLDMFVLSGQPTAGGVAQAISAYAQTVENVDRAYEIEVRAIDGMDSAAALVR